MSPVIHPSAVVSNPMATPHLGSRPKAFTRILALLVAALSFPAAAFPPSPPHLLFGVIRDELGNPITARDGELVLETASGVRISVPVVPGLKPGINFELPVPMDAGLTSDLYRPNALRPTVAFKLRVRLGGVEYLPIEMRGDYSRLGLPAGRTRIDLTLGEDTDGDGLPDAWERAILAAQGGTGTLGDITADGDSDGDGLSNLKEYLAGTYAFDPADGFTVQLVATGQGEAQLEFLAIRGRSYWVQSSSAPGTWKPVGFRVLRPVPESVVRERYDATDVVVVRVSVPAAHQPFGLYRLVVE